MIDTGYSVRGTCSCCGQTVWVGVYAEQPPPGGSSTGQLGEPRPHRCEPHDG